MDTRFSWTTPTTGAHEVFAWLPSHPTAVPHARSFTAAALEDWGLAELTFTTQLIVSELVTNAITHARSSAGLYLRTCGSRLLRCEVSDSSHTAPQLRAPEYDDLSGRGLHLVSALANRWGYLLTSTGKTIWVEQLTPQAAKSSSA
ncbi:ATP-binding protein [Streptomyces fuscichromogenes]|uniref:ATP-binding protein n=1 Tax=Streptomyces fuscichromogenes TaxID=1324013 RepID=UPI0037F1D378